MEYVADTLKSFPSNKEEALTLLFLQNQDLSSLSPEELAKKYDDTKNRINKAFHPVKASQRIGY